jgi:hypothetical protein
MSDGDKSDTHTHDSFDEGDTTKKTVGVEELLLVYPTTMGVPQDMMREEFVNTMLRTKTKGNNTSLQIFSLVKPKCPGTER